MISAMTGSGDDLVYVMAAVFLVLAVSTGFFLWYVVTTPEVSRAALRRFRWVFGIGIVVLLVVDPLFIWGP